MERQYRPIESMIVYEKFREMKPALTDQQHPPGLHPSGGPEATEIGSRCQITRVKGCLILTPEGRRRKMGGDFRINDNVPKGEGRYNPCRFCLPAS